MERRSLSLLGVAAAVALLAQPSVGGAVEQAPLKAAAKSANTHGSLSEIARYCRNNADAATDAHLAWEKNKLAEMEEQLKRTISELNAKEKQYKKWVIARRKLLAKGKAGVVAIFSHMRPDAAASELSAMEDDTAAAVLSKLNPRNASAILDEIDPARAARLTDVMAGIAPKSPETKKSL